MLNFLRKIKGDGTPSLAEAESLSRKIKALDANVVQLVTTLRAIQSAPRGAQKARDYLPQLLEAIRFNLEEELNLAKAIEKETRQEPSKSNYNQDFSEETQANIMSFCKAILKHLDDVFFTVIQDRDAGNQLENKKYIIRETKNRFIIQEFEIMWIQRPLKERGIISKTADIVEDIKNLCLTLINHMLYASLEERINETKEAKRQGLNRFFSLTEKEYSNYNLGDVCPLDFFVIHFTERLKKIIKNK